MNFDLRGKTIWVAGHSGLVGSAVCRRLQAEECDVLIVSHAELDLTRQAETEDWINQAKPDAVILAAARVGGIGANMDEPADFLSQNLAIAQNVVQGAYKAGVSKLLFLGSSCLYPKDAEQPIPEGALLSGPLEPTNEGYAIAKIAGVKLAQLYRKQYGCDFISAMPTNLYGPGDTYDAHRSHVIPALIHKMHMAKIKGEPSVEIWGSGKPMREFLYADDLADALVFLLKHYSDESPVNIGSGQEVSIRELVDLISSAVGYEGEPVYNSSKPDGVLRKCLDCTKLNAMGWKAQTLLSDGLKQAYDSYTKSTGICVAA